MNHLPLQWTLWTSSSTSAECTTPLVIDTITIKGSSTRCSATVPSLTLHRRSEDVNWRRARSFPSSSAVLVLSGSGFETAVKKVHRCWANPRCELLARHFGKHIINTMYGWAEDDEKTQTIWLKMYSSFVQAIDA
jgi:hypothetical protein